MRFISAVRMLFSVAAVVCLAAHTNAGFVIYNGVGAGNLRSDWEAAVGAFSEEKFDDAITPDFSISAIGLGHTGFGINSGRFNDRLIPGSSTTVTFTGPIFAFGANWNLTPGGPGLGLLLTAGSETLSMEIPNNFSGQFFGLTSTSAFTVLKITSGTQPGGAETYIADNFVYAPSVPEPASLAVWSIGIATLSLVRRRRSANKV